MQGLTDYSSGNMVSYSRFSDLLIDAEHSQPFELRHVYVKFTKSYLPSQKSTDPTIQNRRFRQKYNNFVRKLVD